MFFTFSLSPYVETGFRGEMDLGQFGWELKRISSVAGLDPRSNVLERCQEAAFAAVEKQGGL